MASLEVSTFVPWSLNKLKISKRLRVQDLHNIILIFFVRDICKRMGRVIRGK
jgi:hypothetical protein